jgi:GNAT superfamily N-acetyltransferase
MNSTAGEYTLQRLSWPGDQLRVTCFLERSDTWTIRPLSARVAIPDYGRKLLRHGVVVIARYGHAEECGMVAFYCNDAVEHIGFISLLTVHPQYRSQGLGRRLLQHALGEMRTCGMSQVKLEVGTANRTAINLYRSCGFSDPPRGSISADPESFILLHKFAEQSQPP